MKVFLLIRLEYWLSNCNNGARPAAEQVSTPENAAKLQVTVLGNPTRNETVEVEMGGLNTEPVSLDVVSERGILMGQQRIRPGSVQGRHSVQVGRSAGLYVLTVQTPTRVQIVKVVKQ